MFLKLTDALTETAFVWGSLEKAGTLDSLTALLVANLYLPKLPALPGEGTPPALNFRKTTSGRLPSKFNGVYRPCICGVPVAQAPIPAASLSFKAVPPISGLTWFLRSPRTKRFSVERPASREPTSRKIRCPEVRLPRPRAARRTRGNFDNRTMQ